MFTGIILAIGKISAIERKAGDFRLKIDTGKLSLSEAHLGDSIAVNGVCLTAIELGLGIFVQMFPMKPGHGRRLVTQLSAHR